jgi:hypothetical protein
MQPGLPVVTNREEGKADDEFFLSNNVMVTSGFFTSKKTNFQS